jgi:hypothetical protein
MRVARWVTKLILNLSNRWWWVSGFTCRPLNPLYPLNSRLARSQRQSGRFGYDNNPLLLPGIEGGHILLLSQRDQKLRLQRPRAPSVNTPYTQTVTVYFSLFFIDLKNKQNR